MAREYLKGIIGSLPGCLAFMDGTNRRDDIRVSAAAAEIASHALPNFIVSQFRPRSEIRVNGAGHPRLEFLQHGHAGTNLAGRTETTLEAILFNECGLQGMQSGSARQPFDRRDVFAILSHRQSQAGIHANAVGKNGTCAALAVIATLLGAGKTDPLAQEIEKCDSRIEMQIMPPAVDGQRTGHAHVPR